MRAPYSRLWALFLSMVPLGLTACVPDLGLMPTEKPPSAFATEKSFAAPPTDWPGADWWTAYNDKELDALIAEGTANAPDLKIAEARLRQADAAAQQSDATLWPTLTGNATISETRASLNQGFPVQFESFLPHGWHDQGQVSGNLSYDLDLFGKNRAAFAAATSEADAAARRSGIVACSACPSAIASAYANLVQLTADRAAAVDARQCPRAERRVCCVSASCSNWKMTARCRRRESRTPPPKPISTASRARSRSPAISWRR